METTMETEELDHSDDDDDVDITILQYTVGGRQPANHDSPADHYSQVMQNIETLSERDVNYPPPPTHPMDIRHAIPLSFVLTALICYFYVI